MQVALKPTVTKDGAVYKPSKKNNLFMEYWTSPQSETFGNVYQSGLKAGFSKTYSKNLLNVAPKWLSTYIDRTNLTEEHIAQGLQKLATDPNINSKSPADTHLKAYEILMKLRGLDQSKTTTVNIVQPILGGRSTNQDKPKTVQSTTQPANA